MVVLASAAFCTKRTSVVSCCDIRANRMFSYKYRAIYRSRHGIHLVAQTVVYSKVGMFEFNFMTYCGEGY